MYVYVYVYIYIYIYIYIYYIINFIQMKRKILKSTMKSPHKCICIYMYYTVLIIYMFL